MPRMPPLEALIDLKQIKSIKSNRIKIQRWINLINFSDQFDKR